MTDTFLPSIEKPEGLIMKLVYFFTRRQFGKVLTPLKVHAARLPIAFGMFYGKVSQLDKTHAATGVGDAHPASGGTHQHLPFLHRYRPIIHDQGVNEPG